jgi:hypothetical protein
MPHMAGFAGRLRDVLSEAGAGFEDSPAASISRLAEKLAPIYDEARAANRVPGFKDICADSEVYGRAGADPYTHRARQKPRGYAGDAVMLDYIYRPGPPSPDRISQMAHEATTGSPNGRSILWRRDHLAGIITRRLDRPSAAEGPDILSVASGHMRELDVVRISTRRRRARIVALDQDELSLKQCVEAYPDFSISPVQGRVSTLLSGKADFGKFDLIYCAGLFDYLGDRVAVALVRGLAGLLKPAGMLTVGNFCPRNHGRGFMEGMMDWSLILRGRDDLRRLAQEACPDRALRTYTDQPGNVHYLDIAGPV